MPTLYTGTVIERRALNAYIKLMRASESLSSRMAQRLAEQKLTLSQFGALEALLHRGPMCQKVLGEKLLKSTGNVTMVVDNLERRGLVRRERNQQDRRYVTLHLTDAGRELISGVFPEHVEAIVAEMSTLSPEEQDELGRLCRRLGLQER